MKSKSELEERPPGHAGAAPSVGRDLQQAPNSSERVETLGSSQNESKTSRDQTVKSSQADIDIGDVLSLDADGRNKLFQRGLLYEQDDQPDSALKCYLGCFSGLTESTRFPLLPQCLRNVADIYYKKEDYQRAIQFVQAEKLYYENALIDISELQKQIEVEDIEGNLNGGGDTTKLEEARGEEYEQLARLCLERKQPHLALEYAGKASKIRQGLFGDNHPSTLKSLDFFASIYAEVGKQQYTDSLGQLSSDGSPERVETVTQLTPAGQEKNQSGETTPTSILRNRKKDQSSERRKSIQHVRFRDQDDSIENTGEDLSYQQEHEEMVSNTLLVTLFLLCSVLLSVLGVFLYCRLFMETSASCVAIKSYLHYAYMRLKYYYYYYSSTKLLKYV